jgi:histidine triad (HIT) family protein
MTLVTENCVFCKIIKKEVPASFVYEDERALAFMSNRPVNQGHTLVIPKKHYVNIYDIPEDEAAYLLIITKRIAGSVRDAFCASGVRVVQNNGEAAGQVIFHLHFHVIPIHSRNIASHDGAYRDHTNPRGSKDLEGDAEKIRSHLPPN